MGHIDSALPACYRQDLTTPAVVFGGLLIAAATLCGTLEMGRAISPVVEDVQVIGDEHAIGPGGFDPYAVECQQITDKNGNLRFRLASASSHCTKKSVH